ncbi:MAG: cytochrome c [Pseudomonadota bacterium]
MTPTLVASRTALRRLGLLASLVLACAWPAGAFADPAQLALGKELFTRGAVPSCAICHTLKDAGSEGAVGPVLDELKPDAKRVATALRNGIGQMPSFAGQLTEAQIQALAAYVAAASGAGK